MIVLEGLRAPPYSSFDGAIQHLQPEDVMFDARFKVLVESVEHRLNKEEHGSFRRQNRFWEKIKHFGSEDEGTRATGEVT